MHFSRQVRLCFRLAALVLLLAVCTLPAFAAKDTAYLDQTLQTVALPKVLGADTFTYDDVTFHRVLLPRYVADHYGDSAYCVTPGQSDALVESVKKTLYSDTIYPHNEFVTYTQVRAGQPVATCFDDHLATLIETVYQFFGLTEKTPVLDELTCFLLDQLPSLSEDMRHDIEAMYKYKLTKSGTQGTVMRSGQLDGIYYFAQTDPDWADEIFEFEGNGATLKERGCGCASAAMVFSTYHKVEITPKWMRSYALQDAWPVSYGLPNEYFLGISRYYTNLETERYGTVLETPVIVEKQDVDMKQLAEQIGQKGYLAIIHVKAGAFTSHEHYMVLEDYQEIDGTGYFLVADPYVLPSRYQDLDQIIFPGNGNDGLLYASSDLIYRDMMAIILFQQDRNAFPLTCRTSRAETVSQEG